MIKLLLLTSLLLHCSHQGLVQMKNGRLGVNFLGFKAGLDFANGMKSYAETPFGQRASAGFERTSGLFAGADSGVKNVFALAGLGDPISPYERSKADWG